MPLTTTYSSVQRYQGKPLRSLLRKGALDLLSFLHTGAYAHLAGQPRIQFLYFHHVFEDEAQNFEHIVAQLARDHTFISHTEAVERLWTGRVDRAYISWSSDDGLENNLVAAQILQRYGAKACFYVNPHSIGLKDEGAIAAFCHQKLAMPATAFLDWDGVAALLEMGHEIGNHTLAHDRVSEMGPAQFKEDLVEAKRVLEGHCGPIRHFAYPYGRFSDFNKTAFDLVFETGYDSCATAVRGCHGPTAGLAKEDLLLRRDQLIGAWPLRHIRYFMAQSARQATADTHLVPHTYTL